MDERVADVKQRDASLEALREIGGNSDGLGGMDGIVDRYQDIRHHLHDGSFRRL